MGAGRYGPGRGPAPGSASGRGRCRLASRPRRAGRSRPGGRPRRSPRGRGRAALRGLPPLPSAARRALRAPMPGGRPRPVSAEPSAGSVGAVARPGRRSPEGAGPGRLPGMSFERDAGRVEIYTDGACKGNPGPGGWGVLLRWGPHEKELYGGEAETTNNRMELTAAIVALESLTRRVPVVLHTDSTYVRDGITRWVHGWKRNGWRTSGK